MIHKKRGFRIQNQSTAKVGCHLVEEATELLAELLEDGDTTEINMPAVVEEAADVLICLTRILYDCDIPLAQVLNRADKKIDDIWVEDESKVTATDPGFTRRSRAAS